jgi:hypothetical protein
MLITLLALCHVPFAEPVRDRVDVVELNRVYSEDGCPVLTQWIFRDSDGSIVAWKFDRDNSWQCHPPCLIWVDDGKKLRRITAGSWVETHEQYDKETAAMEWHPAAERRGLSR